MNIKQIQKAIADLHPLIEDLDGSSYLNGWKEKLKGLDESQKILLAAVIIYLTSDEQTK